MLAITSHWPPSLVDVLHELWVEEESQTFCLSSALGDRTRSLLGQDAELRWTVEAESHTEAMTAYYAHMGWGDYSTEFPQIDGQPYADWGWAADFATRSDGQVDASLAGDWPIFNQALPDCISSLPPLGDITAGPSTYWIEVAAQEAKWASFSGSESAFICGKATFLQLVAGCVVARYDHDRSSGPSESITIEAFLALLTDWQKQINHGDTENAASLPTTHRRDELPPIDGPTRAIVKERWMGVIEGTCTREDTAAWTIRWVEPLRSVNTEMLVMSGLQTLHGFDITVDPADRNLIKHGGRDRGRPYYHSDEHIASCFTEWLDQLAEFDEDPEGFRERIRRINRLSPKRTPR